jgi:cAMP-dependent protein kinase regulator
MRKKFGSILKIRGSVCAEVFGTFNKKEDFVARVISKSDDQIEMIKSRILNSFIFTELDEKDLITVIYAMEEVQFKKGDTIIKEGDDGDCLYIIESGELDCYKVIKNENKLIKTYLQGETFGELALLYNAPRAATIIAKDMCILWALDRATFNHIVKSSAIKRRENHYKFLKSIEIISSLDDYEISQLSDALKTKKYKAGEYIIRQGDIGDNFYIIEEGEAFASKNFEGSNIFLFRK